MSPPPGAEQAAAEVDALSAHRLRAVGSSTFWRKLLASSGPGYLVAVGYMDPGNWATGLAGGARYGYQLLSVILVANLAAIFLQCLAAKLGIVTGLDLAQACRRAYGKYSTWLLWPLCELAIVACDLAELLGAAIALKLLFGLPLAAGVALIGIEVLVLLGLQGSNSRSLEALILGLTVVIGGCFAFELILARPDLAGIAGGLIPPRQLLSDPQMLYVAMGILGATIMPHNLYLHSAVVKSRGIDRTASGIRQRLRFAWMDVAIALALATFVNAAILILSASIFHGTAVQEVGLEQAYELIAPALGAGAASTMFAVALLASGHNASITGTLAGQIVMEGFTDLRVAPWIRRTVSRLLAMLPAIGAITLYGEAGIMPLLILSQVVLSLQLPFAVYPLVRLTSSRSWMGDFVNRPVTIVCASLLTAVLIGLNLLLALGGSG